MGYLMTFLLLHRTTSAICGIVLSLLALVAPASALTLTEGPKVLIQEGKATITWTTDVVCGSKVNYGTKPDFLDQRASGFLAQQHSVTIENLQPSLTYHFAIASAREKLGSGSFSLGSGTATATSTTTPRAAPTTATSNSSALPAKAASLPKAPPTRDTWGYLGSLQDHYDRHGHDFQAKSPDDYAAQAWHFLQRAKRDTLPMKLDRDGTLRVWDGKTGTFAAYNRDGTAKTFFKPGSPSYWQRQPGRSITPNEFNNR